MAATRELPSGATEAVKFPFASGTVSWPPKLITVTVVGSLTSVGPIVALAITALWVVNVQETGLGRVSPAGSATVLAMPTVYCIPAESRPWGVRLTEYEVGSYETSSGNAAPDELVKVKLAAVTVEGSSASLNLI